MALMKKYSDPDFSLGRLAPSGRVINFKPVMTMVGGKIVYDTRRQ